MADAEPEPDLSRRNMRLGAVVLVLLLSVVGFNLVRRSGSSSDGAPKLSGALRASLEQGGCTVDSQTDKGQAHVKAPTYSVNPPAGGDHDPVPSPARFYDMGNVPADGHLVHSLEHGFVVVWYRPEGVTQASLDGLRDLAGRHRWVLVVPRPSLPTALAATAWHRRLLCPDGAAGPIGNFVTAFRNQGPEKGFTLGGLRPPRSPERRSGAFGARLPAPRSAVPAYRPGTSRRRLRRRAFGLLH